MVHKAVLRLIEKIGVEKSNSLDLSWKNLTEVPSQIARLTNLTELILNSNQLSSLPDWLGELSNLTSLYLRSNRLSSLPESLGKLSNLTQLDLSDNDLSLLPNSLGKLSNLTSLQLRSNQLSSLPDSIGKLSELTKLDLRSNQISSLSDSLSQLGNLTRLDLSFNQLSSLPNSLNKLDSLTELNLSYNQLSLLPDSLGKLSNLTSLYLRSNQLSSLPDSLGQLSNLTALNLRSNQLLSLPESMGKLSKLTWLYLRFNQLSSLPDSLGELSNLTSLELRSNQLSSLPDSLGKLSKLTKFDLSSNQIFNLPSSFKNLEKLELLLLDQNPIPIPPEILRQGWGEARWASGNPRAVLDYYFATRDPDQVHNLYEVKLLIVGEGGSGKTSLANKLLDLDYTLKPDTEDISTQGIDILLWEFTGRSGNQYIVKIWDFGGQEIYHQTHQFFLTQRSFYLLVADSRKEDTDHYFWLKVVQFLSNNSPVVLVQNEKNDCACNLNFKQLRGEFENLRDTYRVNLADNRGLAQLKQSIQDELEKLNPEGIACPNEWQSVRSDLESDARNYIDYTEYQAICQKHGIIDLSKMSDLSQFLHDLGVCLHFQKDPILRQRLILKPNWGTAAVYKILNNVQVRRNWGQFSDADLDQIWKAQEYANMRHELLQLMKEFKVCYEIPRRRGEYIAPHLLSPEMPVYEWDNPSFLRLHYDYKTFMPKGILTRFIVEMHREIENVSDPNNALVWKSGVVLKSGSTRALVVEQYSQRKMMIQVSGNRPRDLMTIIHHEFEKIHDGFERLDYDTRIPCNCERCRLHDNPSDFPLKLLHRCIDQHRQTIECHESGCDVMVQSLIDGVINESDLRDFRSDREQDRPSQASQPPSPTINFSIINQNQNPQVQAMNNIEQHSQGDNVAGDKVLGNKMEIGTVQGDAVAGNKYVYSQNLAQAAQDIKVLLDQLAKEYPNEDEFFYAGQAVKTIKSNPTLRQRITNAFREGGSTAFEEAIKAVTNNPAVSILAAGIKGFATAEAKE